ncbi:MAG: type II toxin-antitoxin system VapC family toxin [Methylococcaceae bacterium]|nr:type II toxin-antitoxin system VapC family toxin [Methylococcaceae bacterium]
MLVDTDVLIWYLKGNLNAQSEINALSEFHISVVSYIELVQGMRNKQELICLRRALRVWNTKISYITEDISAKAMFYVEQYYLSHSLQLADALISATAVANGFDVLTANVKHYRFLKDVSLKEFKPDI